MNMSPLEQFIHIITTISIIFSMVQPTLVYGRELDYPNSQEATATATIEATATAEATATETAVVQPTETETAEATTTETVVAQPTETETADATATETAVVQPTETETVEAIATETATTDATATETAQPTESPTAAASETATPTETATVEATASVTATETATLEATATITATETATVEATANVTATKTATLEATATITAATPTPTATPIPLELKLRMNTTPAFVEAGQLVTVSLTLSNPNQAEMNGLQLQAPLPAGIIYLQGDLKHNPLLNLLVWDIPSSNEAEIEISYQLQIAANSPASALNLGVEIVGGDQSVLAQSQSSLIVTAAPTPQASTEATVQPSIRQRESGPAASLKLKAAYSSLVADGASRSAVVIWVADAEGRPVAEGTEIIIKVDQEGLLKVKREQVRTQNGLAVVRLQAGEQVGQVQLEAQVNGLSAKTEISLVDAKRERLNQEPLEVNHQEIAKIGRELRHTLRQVGNHLEAEDEHYQAVLGQDGQIQVKNKPNQGEAAALSLQLKRVQVGQSVLYNESQRVMKSEGNRVNYSNTYFSEEYQALSGGLEQFFIFKRPLPTAGDLVITLEVETKLKGQRLSNRQGIVFYPPQGKRGQSDPGLLIYSGALVRDNDGREMYAKMGYKNNKIRLTVPEAWLAEAEYPLVIDPLIGDPTLIANPQGGASAVDMAYNSSDNKYFLVWQETGLGSESNVYARHIAADGTLDESQISLSSVGGGSQSQPTVAYNSNSNEYLAVWYDHTNHQIHGRRFDNNGGFMGDDFALSLASSSGQQQPSLVYNPTSNSYLLAYSSYNISSGLAEAVYVQNLNSDGSLNGSARAVAPSGSEQSQPDVVHNSGSNEYLITWQDNRNGNYDIYAQLLDSSGQLSGNEINISTDSAAQDVPQVAYISNGGSGQYLVGWRQHVSGETYTPYKTYAQRINSDGSLQGSSFTIVGNISGSRGYLDLTSNNTDKYLAVWDLNDDGEGDIKARIINPDGSKNSTKGIATDNNDQGLPAVGYNSSASQYLIAWEDSRLGGSIYGRLRNSSAGSVSSAFVMSRIQRSHKSPAVTVNPANTTEQAFLAVWEENRDGTDDIYGQWLNQNGQATGSEISIGLSAGDEDNPKVAYNTNSQQALVVWHSNQTGNDDIYSQRVDSNGLQGSVITLSNASGNQRYPQVAANSQEGSWLTVWAYNGQAYGRLVNSDGTLDSEGILATNALQVDVTYNPSANEYLLAWVGWSASNDDIYVQRISATGQLLGSVQLISSPQHQSFEVSLSYHQAGDHYLVVWADGNNNTIIQGQRVLSDGTLAGNVITIYEYPGGDYQGQTASSYDSGLQENIVVWRSWANNQIIHAARIDGDGNLVGTIENLVDNTDAAQPQIEHHPTLGYGMLVWWQSDNEVYAQRYLKETQLINIGDDWRYFKGTQAPPADWNSLSFDDSSWLIGPTGIGYGDSDDATVLSDMNTGYLTVFARREFTLDNIPAGLQLVIDYDDGFVAYLNGAQVALDGVNNTAFDAPADSEREAGTTVVYDLTPYIDLLQQGQNVLAIQGHNIDVWSTDFSLIPSLRAYILSHPSTPSTARDWQLQTTPPTLAVVGHHALAYDSNRNRVVLYGGNATGYPYEDSTWEYDGLDWNQIVTTQNPTARYGAVMAYNGNQVVLFGGSDQHDTALDETWAYDGANWTLQTPANTPPARTQATLVAAPDGTLYLFGGNNGSSYYNDLWSYSSGSWTDITPGTSPPVRTLTALVYDTSTTQLLLFGGRDETGTALGDTWLFDLTTNTWLEQSGGSTPPARLGHSLTIDTAQSNIMLTGGSPDNGKTRLGDTWHYTPATGWQEATPATPLPARAHHQAIYGADAIILISHGQTWHYQ